MEQTWEVLDLTTELRPPDPAALPRDVATLLTYWQDARGDAFAPSRRSFDLMAVPSRLLPWSLLVEVRRDPLDFVYSFWGDARTTLQGADYTGRSVRDMEPPALVDKLMSECRHVVETRRPVHVLTRSREGRPDAFRYEFLRLPLSADGNAVTQIFAVGFSGDAEEARHDHFRR